MGDGGEFEQLKAEVAARDAELSVQRRRNAELEEQVAKLTETVRVLRELVGRNSSNSNLPPSSDPPGGAKPRGKKGKGRRRGGQKGHRGSHRELLPPHQVDAIVDLFPPECESCWQALPEVPDPRARRYQHTELRPFAGHVTEYRRHAVVCPFCRYKTRPAYDPEVIPRSAFGPRLMSVVVMLTGVYHLSRRKAATLMWELLGVSISVGAISLIEQRMSEALAPPVDEAWDHARMARVKHADGTTWLRAGTTLALWTVATAAVTVFKVLGNEQGATLRHKLFVTVRGILVSDRATALKFWAMHRRQVCWAHLARKFISFSQRDGPAGALGQDLVDYTSLIFRYWSDYRDGRLSRAQLRAWMAPVRAQLEAALERAVALGVRGMSGSCADMLEHRAALWTFVHRDGVEPTNNHAERELRAFVLWRKRSFGAQSDRGDRFAERVMTIAHTARKQGRDILGFLTACCDARLARRPAPSLLAA